MGPGRECRQQEGPIALARKSRALIGQMDALCPDFLEVFKGSIRRPKRMSLLDVGVSSAHVLTVIARFEVIGSIREVETMASRFSIRERRRLERQFGKGRWRKLKGVATIRDANGMIRKAELHWYEAHGIGRRKLKVKRFLD